MSVTVEFQREKAFASVSRLHTISAVDSMLTSTRQVIAKAPLVWVNLASLICDLLRALSLPCRDV